MLFGTSAHFESAIAEQIAFLQRVTAHTRNRGDGVASFSEGRMRSADPMLPSTAGVRFEPNPPRAHASPTFVGLQPPRSSRRSPWDETPETGDLPQAPQWLHSCVLPEIARGRD